MGRIVAFVGSAIIQAALSEAEYKISEGAIDSKASLFIRMLKQYLRKDGDLYLKVFKKKSKTPYFCKVSIIEDNF